jgi:hypothetical protein
MKNILLSLALIMMLASCVKLKVEAKIEGDDKVQNNITAPLHLIKPEYPVKYDQSTPDSISKVLNRVAVYLESAKPKRIVGGIQSLNLDIAKIYCI